MNINDNRRYITLLIIIVLGIFLAWSLSGFLTALLSAIILYVLMKPLMRYLLVKQRWNQTPATVVAMIITFLTILGPVWTLYGLLASKINYALSNGPELIEGLTMNLIFLKRPE